MWRPCGYKQWASESKGLGWKKCEGVHFSCQWEPQCQRSPSEMSQAMGTPCSHLEHQCGDFLDLRQSFASLPAWNQDGEHNHGRDSWSLHWILLGHLVMCGLGLAQLGLSRAQQNPSPSLRPPKAEASPSLGLRPRLHSCDVPCTGKLRNHHQRFQNYTMCSFIIV